MAKRPDEEPLREEARKSLVRMQTFDIATLPREGDLGTRFHFREATEPASRLIDLYKRLPESVLDDLPQNQLQQIRDQSNQDFTRFDDILKFDPAQQNSTQVRDGYIQNLRNAYQTAFTSLHPFIAYSLCKTADFQRLEGDARATLQAVRDQGEALTRDLETQKQAAERVLEDVRKVAAEQGVSQQAIYFKESATEHDKQAGVWQNRTLWVATGLAIYAFATVTLHKIPWLAPRDTYDAIQLGISKILVFAVVSYVLYLCARNFLSHKHNAVVDRHRQNALMTYKAIVDAAGDTPNREVILVQAAACIFAPQGTGYTADTTPAPPGAQSVVEFATRPLKGGE